MKTKVASLLVGFSLITTLSMAQEKITVEAQSTDISNNLDLKAVSTVFGESSDLEEFEKKLNDYDNQISNLDLNNDGQVDYLRVIEKNENGVHVVGIQAVLDKDVYQDVASIIVEKDQNNNPTVQVVGDPYLYGNNYIIEPAYAYTPSIFSFFWGPNYYSWDSPYYWGYYPSYYHRMRPCGLDLYYSNVYGHINHNQRYYYTNSIRNSNAVAIRNSIRRNDLGVRQPERSFSNRNANVRNKRDFEFNRNSGSMQTRPSVQRNTSGTGSRPVRAFDNTGNRNQGIQNGSRTNNSTINVRTNVDSRNSTTRGYSSPSNGPQNSTINRDQNRNYQSRPTNVQRSIPDNQPRNTYVQPRIQNSAPRENNNSRPAQVSQPSRQNNVQSQPAVRQQSVSTPRSAPAPAQRSESNSRSGNSSRSSDSNRR